MLESHRPESERFYVMLVVLLMSRSAYLPRFIGLAAGSMVGPVVKFRIPLSGMTMNPARKFASAAPGMQWKYF